MDAVHQFLTTCERKMERDSGKHVATARSLPIDLITTATDVQFETVLTVVCLMSGRKEEENGTNMQG